MMRASYDLKGIEPPFDTLPLEPRSDGRLRRIG